MSSRKNLNIELQEFLQFEREDELEVKLGKLEHALKVYGFYSDETLSLFAALLSLSLPDTYPPLNLSPQKQKEKTFDALITWLQKAAEEQPVRLEIEDLHWADPSTLELLGGAFPIGARIRLAAPRSSIVMRREAPPRSC